MAFCCHLSSFLAQIWRLFSVVLFRFADVFHAISSHFSVNFQLLYVSFLSFRWHFTGLWATIWRHFPDIFHQSGRKIRGRCSKWTQFCSVRMINRIWNSTRYFLKLNFHWANGCILFWYIYYFTLEFESRIIAGINENT